MKHRSKPIYEFYVYAEMYPYFQRISKTSKNEGFKTELEANEFVIECENFEKENPYPKCTGVCVCDNPESESYERHLESVEILINEWREKHPAYRDDLNDPKGIYDRYFVTTMTICPGCNNDPLTVSGICEICNGEGFAPLAPINTENGETLYTARGLLFDVQMCNLDYETNGGLV